MTKHWDDHPRENVSCIAPRRSAEDVILTALRDGPDTPRCIREQLEHCGIAREEAQRAIDGLLESGRIKIAQEICVSLRA